MDAISYSHSVKQEKRIKKFNTNPDSNSGVLTQPKVIEAGETVTIKSGRQAILADTVIDGELVIEAGGDVFIPAGAGFSDLDQRIASIGPIGSYVMVQEDLIGATVPSHELYIKLEAGLTGAGQYNEGKLTNETVTGSAPLVVATAEIADPESPLFGQVVHLLETEERFLRAGQAGRVQNDQMQMITGSAQIGANYREEINNSAGAFSGTGVTRVSYNSDNGTNTNGTSTLQFNSANSPSARVSSTTNGETRTKNIGVSVYLRIK